MCFWASCELGECSCLEGVHGDHDSGYLETQAAASLRLLAAAIRAAEGQKNA